MLEPGFRALALTTLAFTTLAALAGCAAPGPLSAIPAHERTMLEAEARLAAARAPAQTPAGDRRGAVESMLSRARGAGPAPLLLRFEGAAIAPDPAQREAIAGFAKAAQGAPRLVVTAQPGLGAGAQMLGPRRAIAVAKLLEAEFPEVDLRFDAALTADLVRIRLAQGSEQ